MVVRRKFQEEPPAASPSAVRPRVGKWLVQLLLLCLLAGLLVGGLLWFVAFVREQVRDHERYQVNFADIQCNPPPGMQRQEFLDEVRYLSRLAERFSIFEQGLSDRLQAGFAQHPWVAKVEKVELVPPHEARVALVHRQPVLAVVVTTDLADTFLPVPSLDPKRTVAPLPVRIVDVEGVLLPKKVPQAHDLPVMYRAPRPSGAAGQRWGDAGVHAAAQTAVLLKPHLERGKIKALTWSDKGLVLWAPTFTVVWGNGLDSAKADEATVAVKEKRLLELSSRAKPPAAAWLWMHEFDVRPRDATVDRLAAWEVP